MLFSFGQVGGRANAFLVRSVLESLRDPAESTRKALALPWITSFGRLGMIFGCGICSKANEVILVFGSVRI